jgi:tRNA(Arg) A34 adenosine deaminase TadA
MTEDLKPMRAALEEAMNAARRGEVPVGAVIADPGTGEIFARAGNRTIELNDPSAHAEMLVIRDACAQKNAQRLEGLSLFVTLEPCPMCAAAIGFARIKTLYFGAYDTKSGGVTHGPRIFDHSTAHHKPAIYGGIEEKACSEMLRDFFRARRSNQRN